MTPGQGRTCYITSTQGYAFLTLVLWGLVNNAGIGDHRGLLEWQPFAEYERIWRVNCLGVIRMTHAFKDLIKTSRGRIVNVSSICAKWPKPGNGTYTISKYALAAYTDVIRVELAQFGVIVAELEPGFFRSALAVTFRNS